MPFVWEVAMADPTPQEMANKLLATDFGHSAVAVEALSQPLADTPMVLTLDELRPYELDPRLTRNPLYDEIKASIRERGLDSPPPVTRRPGADHYIIRNGGNTRLAIMRELWTETKDERFFRIACLYRPWPERGEIIALTGHLAENELHGGLTFIERALGVEKAREIYEQDTDKPLSQSELARRLTADGYPIQQSHISRMQETVRYLLPAIPSVLYGGLGRRQVERLATLRKAAELTWERHTHVRSPGIDFESVFHDTLAVFDTDPKQFSTARFQDELLGTMADLLGVDYNMLELDIDQIEQRQRVVTSPPTPEPEQRSTGTEPGALTPHTATPAPASIEQTPASPPGPPLRDSRQSSESEPEPQPSPEPEPPGARVETDHRGSVQGPVVTPAATTERLEAIQQLIAGHAGEPLPDLGNTLQAIPLQADSLFPITDIWHIDPSLDSPDRLRIHIAQFAREIAAEADLVECVEPSDEGIGFLCRIPPPNVPQISVFGRTILALLHALSASHNISLPRPDAIENFLLDDGLGVLLLGSPKQRKGTLLRLEDTGLVKLFRLLRLARRLADLETDHSASAY